MFKLEGVESDLSLFAAETHYSLCPAFRSQTKQEAISREKPSGEIKVQTFQQPVNWQVV